jgi:hypothetical protein
MKTPDKFLGIVSLCLGIIFISVGFYGNSGTCYAVGTKISAPDIKVLEQMITDLKMLRVQRNAEVEELFTKMKDVLDLLNRPEAQESLSVAAFDATRKEFAIAAGDLLSYFSGTTQAKRLADAESRVEKVRWTIVSTPGAVRPAGDTSQ